MESEMLKIFDQQGIYLGTATRSEVHKAGHWHETFHCWFTERINGEDFLYFQVRSSAKKDYTGLLDITAAGHILAHETPLDGLREVKEELGIDVTVEDLHSFGTIKDSLISPEFIDRELCRVFLYKKHQPFEKFQLQKEEVSGIMVASMTDFEDLWFAKSSEIRLKGFMVSEEGEKKPKEMLASKKDFVPHEDEYINRIIQSIRNS
jgi:isopentenyldiphosphate isomerase